jgi:small GTP-binding protein
MEIKATHKKKVCLLGDSAVGKTSLIRKYVLDEFSDAYLTTIGTKTSKKEMFLVFPEDEKEFNVTLMIWDIMGQPSFRNILKEAYFHGANGGIVVCDLTRKGTLENIPEWIEILTSVVGDIPLIFIGNKCDLDHQAEFGLEDIQNVAEKYGDQSCFLTSAKDGRNVNTAFTTIAKEMLKPKGRETP